jgi:hypothetical protein
MELSFCENTKKSSYLLYLITMNIKAKNMPPMYDIIASINSH